MSLDATKMSLREAWMLWNKSWSVK